MTEKMVAPVLTEETIRKEIPENKGSSPPEAAGKKEKFFGIELLRILATFYIILLHVVGQGGVAAASGGGKGTYMARAICCWHSPTLPSTAMRSSAALSGAKAGLSCRGCCRYG